MSSKNKLVFPAPQCGEFGLTLRDWFAGQLAAGVMSANMGEGQYPSAATVAKACYIVADALIDERDK